MDEAGLTPSAITRPFDPIFDEPCIYSTWRNASYYGAIIKPDKVGISAAQFFREQTFRIKDLLKTATCNVAVLDDDPQFIVGYCVFRKNHLDFVYVKADYRTLGIARMLIPATIKTASDQLTKIGRDLAIKKNWTIQGEPNGRKEEKRNKPRKIIVPSHPMLKD